MPISLAGAVVKALRNSKISKIMGVGYLVEPNAKKAQKRKRRAKKAKLEAASQS